MSTIASSTSTRPDRTLDLDLTLEELTNIERVINEDAPQEIRNSFRDAKDYYRDRVRDLCEEGVSYAAAFLDEHVIGWADRITRPLNMGSATDCVLGQVFDPELPENQEPTGDRRFLGLLPPKPKYRLTSGFLEGSRFLLERGYDDRPFTFSAYEATPFWEAEISRRVR